MKYLKGLENIIDFVKKKDLELGYFWESLKKN